MELCQGRAKGYSPIKPNGDGVEVGIVLAARKAVEGGKLSSRARGN